MGYSKFSDGVSVDAIGRAQMQGQTTLLAHLLEQLKDHPGATTSLLLGSYCRLRLNPVPKKRQCNL